MPQIIKNPNTGSQHPYKAIMSFSKDGKRKRKSKVFDSHKDAELWIAQQQVEEGKGADAFTEDMLLTNYFAMWVKLYKEPSVEPATLDSYRLTLTHLKRLLPNVRMRDLTKGVIQNYFNHLNMSEASAKKQRSQLRACLKDAVLEGVIAKNPTDTRINIVADRSKTKQDDHKFMSRTDYYRVRNFLLDYDYQLKDVNRFALFIIANTAMRAGEALALKEDDLDYDNNEIRIDQSWDSLHKLMKEPKTEKAKRSVPVTPQVMVKIRRWVTQHKQWLLAKGITNPERYLMWNKHGHLPDAKNLNASYHQLQVRLGIEAKFSTHTLRHTIASLMISQGISLSYVSAFLGHASTVITQTYYIGLLPDTVKEEQDKALAVLDQANNA